MIQTELWIAFWWPLWDCYWEAEYIRELGNVFTDESSSFEHEADYQGR